MNAVEFTNVVRRAEHVESPYIAKCDGPQPALGIRCNARLRYTLLASIALLTAWLVFAIFSSIGEINSQLDGIRTTILLPRSK